MHAIAGHVVGTAVAKIPVERVLQQRGKFLLGQIYGAVDFFHLSANGKPCRRQTQGGVFQEINRASKIVTEGFDFPQHYFNSANTLFASSTNFAPAFKATA